MRKFLPYALITFVVLYAACSPARREWKQAQRAEFREMIDAYRQMVYLSDLTDTEFILFTDDVASSVEVNYPVYTTLVAMPSLSDSVDMWVVTTIVEDIDEDAHNIRHIYPYHTLVEQGIVPSNLDEAGRQVFYRCLAQKINNYFTTTEAFFYAVISNNLNPNIITTMQNECASDLFGWTIEVDTTVIEE